MTTIKPETAESLLCFHCKKNHPVKRVVLSDGIVDMHFCLCSECLLIDERVILKSQLERK